MEILQKKRIRQDEITIKAVLIWPDNDEDEEKLPGMLLTQIGVEQYTITPRSLTADGVFSITPEPMRQGIGQDRLGTYFTYEWNITHRKAIQSILEELLTQIKKDDERKEDE